MWLDPFFANKLTQDVVATILTFAVALAWLRAMDGLAHQGLMEQRLSRKIIHIGTGPLFVLCWNLFSAQPQARWLAALVPLAITAQFVMVGLGLMKDVASKKDIATVVAANGNADLRGYCCVALGLLGENDPGVTKYLVEIVQHVNVPELKAAAALALAKLGASREALETLKESLKDRNRYFKMSAIMAIGYFRDWGTVADLQQMVKTETNPEARAIGVVALGYIGESASVPVLKQISEDFNYITVFLNMKSVDQILRLF